VRVTFVLGVLALLFGILVFDSVLVGYLSLNWIFAIYRILGSIMAIMLGFPRPKPRLMDSQVALKPSEPSSGGRAY
jgi:uncharacterized membrane protein HdeD (DUF308 family)